MNDLGLPDPQWQFALVIKNALETRGSYVLEVDTRDAQALVDIHWAARQAGRLLGTRVKVDRSSHYGHADSIVTATVRCVTGDGPERTLAQTGLERLLQSVQAAHRTPTHAPDRDVPHPRQGH